MKKLKIIIMSMVIAFISFGVLVNVNADTLKYKSCVPIGSSRTSTYNKYTVYTTKYFSPYGYVNSYSNGSNNRIVFCFEHGVADIKASGRSFKKYKLGSNMLNRGIGYAGWYIDADGKGSPDCTNARVAGQVWVHMLSYRYEKGKSCDNCDLLDISDSKLKSRVKSMLNTSSSKETSIANHIVQIRTLHINHNKKPVFVSTGANKDLHQFDSCELDSDKGVYTCTKKLKDKSGIIEKFDSLNLRFKFTCGSSSSNVKVTRNKSNITVTATIKDENIKKSVSFYCSRTLLDDDSTIMKSYKGSKVQDMAYSVPSTTTSKTTVSLKKDIETAVVKVKKVLSTDGKPLKDVKLRLYDDKKCTERSTNYKGETFAARTTDAEGYAIWEGLYYDEDNTTYYVGEAESKEYNKLCKKVTAVKTSEKDKTDYTTVENVPKGIGSIEIEKTNSYTGKPLAGRTFGIYSDNKCENGAEDTNGEELASKSTDEHGKIVWENLSYPSGKDEEQIYYVQETFSGESFTSGDGYSIDVNADIYKNTNNYCIPVTLKAKGVAFEKDTKKTLKISNIPYGNLTILKQDVDTGASIKGAVFALYKKDGKTKATNIEGKELANATTNASGVAKFENVPYGDYILKEVATPSGYKKLEKDLSITLNEDTNSLKYQGQRIIGVPVNQAVTSYKLGDVDGDEKITSKDLALVTDFAEKISKSEKVTITANQKYAADVNKDGTIEQTDVDLIKKYLDGDKTAFNALEHGVFVLGDKVYNLGDPTNDGKIDEKDLEMAQKIYLGEDTDYTDLEYYACDLNNDGTVDYNDINLFGMYLGTGKTSETLEPQITGIDLTKLDYNGDKKNDLKDVYFLKGVLIASDIEIGDYDYDLNGDDEVTSVDVTLFDNYIKNIGKERAWKSTNDEKKLEEIQAYLDKINEYKGKEVTSCSSTSSTTESKTTSDTSTGTAKTSDSVSAEDCSKYDYDKSGTIDDNDIIALKIDYNIFDVDYNSDATIDKTDKELLESLINGIAGKSNTSFTYDINGDKVLDTVDVDLYSSYVDGDKNLFEKVEITNDVNSDGKVDETDLKLVEEAIAKKDTATANSKADVNNDGVIDNDDIISIKKAIGGYKEFDVLAQMVVSYEEKISIAVTNVPLDILISKQNITNSKEVEGARIVIKDSKGNKVIDYVSKTKAKKFYLATGTYVLTETVTPTGYQKLLNNIKFKVQADGNVKILSAKSNMYKTKKTKTYGEYDHLVIYNTPQVIKAPKTGSVRSVLEILGGIMLIGSGAYFVYYRSKKNNPITK